MGCNSECSAGKDIEISGEVKDPTRTIPRALAVSCLGTIVVDTLAVAVGVSVATDHEEWADGHFVLVGLKVGGKALQSAFLVGAAISTLGLLCSMLYARKAKAPPR